MKHVMLDLETLGTKPGCVVLSIGAVEFSPAGLGPTHYSVPNVAEQKEIGLFEDPSTVAWWAKQSPAARKVFTEEQAGLHDALSEFGLFCGELGAPKDICVWGNGSDFANPILREVFDRANRKAPWGPYNNRCYRTLKSFAPSLKLARQGTYHNALDDARYQAQHAILLLNDLGLWKGVSGA